MTKRAAKEEKMALESLAIRKEVKNGKTLEDASKAVTGKRACDEGEYPDVTVKSGISVGSSGGGSSGGSDKIGNEYNANKDCRCGKLSKFFHQLYLLRCLPRIIQYGQFHCQKVF